MATYLAARGVRGGGTYRAGGQRILDELLRELLLEDTSLLGGKGVGAVVRVVINHKTLDRRSARGLGHVRDREDGAPAYVI